MTREEVLVVFKGKAGIVAATAVMASSIVIASVAVASAGGPTNYVDDGSQAVGSGVFGDSLVGFRASGAADSDAATNVVAACERAGGVECTADEVSNEGLCVVSVGDNVSHVVVGGAGATPGSARENALARAKAAGDPLPPSAVTLISFCG